MSKKRSLGLEDLAEACRMAYRVRCTEREFQATREGMYARLLKIQWARLDAKLQALIDAGLMNPGLFDENIGDERS